MNGGAALHVLGRLCVLLALLLVVPWLVCAAYGGLGTPVADAFLHTAALSLALGLGLRLAFPFVPAEFGFGEAFATVTFSWLVFTALGALPFLLTDAIPSVLDASFEVLSGFTTTGASILPDPAVLAPPLLFWRAMTHWIGGMGIVALSVAVLPALGAGGNFLFQAEMPGPENEKLLPRISSTAKLLWGIYVSLTVAEIAALWAAGMSPFDAICHSFATVATGGFGTRADSFASYGPLIQWIVIVFMFLAGMNFVMLWSASRGRFAPVLRNTEVRVYGGLMFTVCALVVYLRWTHEGAPSEAATLVRESVFSVVSLGTTTGFATADYSVWPVVTHPLLMFVMLCGACAGSTSGASKIARLLLWAKHARREVLQLLRPSAVLVVKVGGRVIPDQVVGKSTAFLLIYLASLGVGSLAMMWIGLGGEAALSSVLTCLSGVGPGFGEVGPTHNYAAVPGAGKAVLMFAMLLGRLEFLSMLVLLSPIAWRR